MKFHCDYCNREHDTHRTNPHQFDNNGASEQWFDMQNKEKEMITETWKKLAKAQKKLMAVMNEDTKKLMAEISNYESFLKECDEEI